MQSAPAAESKEALEKKAFKDRFFKGLCLNWFMAVVAHTINLQTEAIVLTRACNGDLARTSRLMANSNGLASILGLVANGLGGKLADSFGRKQCYAVGPLVQMITGLLAFRHADNALILVTCKAFRKVFTTFSGTVIGSAAMRDVFDAPSGELKNKELEARTKLGLAIMLGPLLEAFILKKVRPGNEKVTYLMLSALGGFTLVSNTQLLPETLSKAKRAAFDFSSALQAANPFAFLKVFTKGSAAFQKLATIVTLQSVVDGKTMSDLAQLWMREHLKLDVSSIRNFIMGFGLASALSSDLVTKPLTNKMSVWAFTSLTNFTNFVAFFCRGLKESPLLFFSMLPIMLPGVNGNSAVALLPHVSELATASGFGKGESSAYLNNLREVTCALATVIYGYFYAWCRRSGVNPGYTYALAGFLGAALPQLVMMSTVKPEDLEFASRGAK